MATIPTNRPPASVWEWLQASLLAGNLAWTTLCLGGYRAETLVVTTLLTAALLAVHFLAQGFARDEPRPVHPAGWLLLPFLAYAAVNAAWITPVRWLGWADWSTWAQLVAVFWVVLNGIRSRGPRRALFLSLVLVGIAGVVLACYQRFVQPDWVMLGRVTPGDLGGRASGSFGLPNSFAGYLLLILPSAGALALRRSATASGRVWWGWVTAVLLVGLLLTISRGAWIALAVALVAAPLVAGRGGWGRRLQLAAWVVCVLAVVAGVGWWKSPKLRERFTALALDGGERTRPIMWRAAWHLAREHPVLGTGAGSYNTLFERHRPEGFADEPLWAHNDYLNTLCDYGGAGFILLFGGWALILVRCVRKPDTAGGSRQSGSRASIQATAAGIALLAFALHLGLEFHLKLPALALAFATTAALAVGRRWESVPPAAGDGGTAATGRLGRQVAALLLVVGTCALASVLVPRVRSEAERQTARRALDALGRVALQKADLDGRLPATVAALRRATALDAGNAQAWSDLSHALTLMDLVEPARRSEWGREAEAAAERALASAPVCYEFWIRRGVARDIQGRWREGGPDFAQALKLAPNQAVAWYHYAEHLARFSGTRQVALAALETCLRLDPGNAPGLALRQRLAVKPKPN